MLIDLGITFEKYCLIYCGDDRCDCSANRKYKLDFDLLGNTRMTPQFEKLDQLADTFEKLSQEPTNMLDPPFDSVSCNLKPETWKMLSKFIRDHNNPIEQAPLADTVKSMVDVTG